MPQTRFFMQRLLAQDLLNNLPATLTVRTWPPGKKEKLNRRVIAIHPMSYFEAKRKAASGTRGIEIYGHASAELKIDFRRCPNILSNPNILTLLKNRGINEELLDSLVAYVSWFPKGDVCTTGRTIEASDAQELAEIIPNEEIKDIEGIKRQCLEFFRTEYKAMNSKYEMDVYQYGEPEPNRVFVLTQLDFAAVFYECMQMMKLEISSKGKPIMEDLADDATYFGLDMLRQHRNFISIKATDTSEQHEPFAPEHVCTTAVMRLLKAGIGNKRYISICRKLIAANPQELTYGLPLVPLTHHLAHQLSLQEQPQIIDDVDISKPEGPK